jgi:hypothetical protein
VSGWYRAVWWLRCSVGVDFVGCRGLTHLTTPPRPPPPPHTNTQAVLAQFDVIVVLEAGGTSATGSTSGTDSTRDTGGTRGTGSTSGTHGGTPERYGEDASAWAAATGWNVTLRDRHARDSLRYSHSSDVSEWMPRVGLGGRATTACCAVLVPRCWRSSRAHPQQPQQPAQHSHAPTCGRALHHCRALHQHRATATTRR